MIRAGFKWMFLIIGTTIGAGYASGRELWEFFGHESGLAITLFAILFTMSCYIIMVLSYQKQSSDYVPVLRMIVGKRLTGVYDFMIFLYLFTVTVVMIAGSGATGQVFQLSYWWGIAFIIIALILLFIKGINGLLMINQLILPLLIMGLLTVLLIFIYDEGLMLFSHWHEQRNWMSAFPFTALNILPLIAVIGAVGNKIRSKREIWIASVGSGLILGGVSYIYNSSLIQIADEILLYEIPLFAILKEYPMEMIVWMSLLLWFAIFTTAAANVLGLVSRLQPYWNIPIGILVLGILLPMIPLTLVGFSTLISYIYPAYGLLNLYVLSRLICYPFWKKTVIENEM
ncbi:MAG TPA: hypothetical protein VK111_06330 [Virgibacillus sp.]|nr:hypothetical protein [Virgibacillus sp.]